MVFDERLGYDPDEWEECPESEHFMVFSPFTRYLLTAAAIAFAYYFFKLLDEHKNGPASKEEATAEKKNDEAPQTAVHLDGNEAIQNVKHQLQELPSDAEQLLREADQYLQSNTDAKRSPLSEKVFSKFPSLELDITTGTPISATPDTFHNTMSAVDSHLRETKTMDLSPRSQDSTQFEQIASEPALNFEHVPPHLRNAAQQYYEQQQQQRQNDRPPVPQHTARDIYEQQRHGTAPSAFQPVSPHGSLGRKLAREKRLSEQDEKAMQDWEAEKALLESERLKKLMDHEAGGESNTDLSTSQKAYDMFAPASHISYESRSGEAQLQPLTPLAARPEGNLKMSKYV
ncbi:unnamed protein product [Caenorhabditis bovis]|uniref:Uncharacterized protein n=1 Tax=Caenorhabditis bovis TaxID=2654633 RepID=A0A8S1FF35_9PELO|nr:unnamed protein product [Caenorhabditis bovis]